MKWFDRWLLKRLKSAHSVQAEEEKISSYSNNVIVGTIGPSTKSGPDELDTDHVTHFSVYHASGGRVIQTTRYDRRNDRSIRGLYVITAEQDFGREIDKIITMDALK